MKKIMIGLLIVISCLLVIRGYHSIYYLNKTYKIKHTYDINQTEIADVQIKTVQSGMVNGYHFIPDHKTHNGVIIVFGGSEGECEQWFGERYSPLGYEVLCLYYFGSDNQPAKLSEVPIEFFDEALAYLNNPDDLTVYGVSKGAELALLLATRYDCIKHLILNEPSSHIYPGMDLGKSAWTEHGEPIQTANIPKEAYLPALGFFYDLLVKKPTGCIKVYDNIIANQKDSDIGRINVEDINEEVDMLMFAATDDQMWPSVTMANIIKDHRPVNTELIILEGAGHMFHIDHLLIETNGCIFYTGGTLETNKAAYQLFDSEIEHHLNKWCQ
ncbi:acyl-CoA thioester hydrolase/BAAT C-terminal domain-containing protein [Granulicatella balaenopterae]|uniref:acyl-CoA thioester hydrolase/BAAT C-terminal domain-containing protein n=1 Tax=Granulicatella balaenopterae TaxID=137733 RepID=UPI0015A68B99|nr:acyl-CoA thioester hydrolase/BAAT C-terminal domain-containing protein [Granulicatella balaenopterae]